MMEMTTKAVPKRDAQTWKDRLMLVFIGLGGLLTVAWCATITGVAVWLIGQTW